jgi:hypothetical protein
MKEKRSTAPENNFAFGTINYKLLLIGLAVLLLGYLLMVGGGSEDPNVFNGDELFSFRRITLAPLVLLAGYIFIFYAILKNHDEAA